MKLVSIYLYCLGLTHLRAVYNLTTVKIIDFSTNKVSIESFIDWSVYSFGTVLEFFPFFCHFSIFLVFGLCGLLQ